MISHGRDLTGRGARGNNHAVSHGGFARQVELHNVATFVVVE